ncbi:MAG: hypothetical protein NT166_17600 [Candidatus Aminicenantes bacterium]|nr:hypothetical protein [Candidatus Aminicenantes bacterium]
MNLAKIDGYFNRYEIDFTHESEAEKTSLLKNTDILDKDGKVTIAGLVIFGINPQRYLYNAGISFAHFNGNEITADLIDKLGRGIPMVCNEVEKNHKKIDFKELGEEFKVILYL